MKLKIIVLLMMMLWIGQKNLKAEDLDLYKFRYDENVILSNLIKNVVYSENYYIVTEKYMLFIENELQFLERKVKAGQDLINYYENLNIEKYQIQIKILLTTTLIFSVCLIGVISGIIIYSVLRN